MVMTEENTNKSLKNLKKKKGKNLFGQGIKSNITIFTSFEV